MVGCQEEGFMRWTLRKWSDARETADRDFQKMRLSDLEVRMSGLDCARWLIGAAFLVILLSSVVAAIIVVQLIVWR